MTAIAGWTVGRWPFDMVKFLDYYTLLFHEDAGHNIDVYEAYCGTDNVWVATEVISDMSSINAPTTYPVNIDVADFGQFYVLTYAFKDSGSLDVKSFFRDPSMASSTSAITSLPSSSVPEFITCCNFKGQVVVGGVVSLDPQWTQLGRCSVAWGKIGRFDFTLSDNVGSGIKTAGYRKMPWSDWDQGVVWKVMRLEDVVMIYGNGGRAFLYPYQQDYVVGYGLKELDGPGVPNGFVVGGCDNLHGFIDINDEFWIASGKGELKKLGYKEWFKDLREENEASAVGTPICVSYSKVRKSFFICGVSTSYVLTDHGLYTCTQSTTGVGEYRGNIVSGFIKDLADDEARFTTVPQDFGYRGMKTLESLEFGLDNAVGSIAYHQGIPITHQGQPVYHGDVAVTGGVDFKNNYREEYRTGVYKTLSPNGVCFPIVTATDFKVKFKVLNYKSTGLKIDSVLARMKLVQRIQSDSSRYVAGGRETSE